MSVRYQEIEAAERWLSWETWDRMQAVRLAANFREVATRVPGSWDEVSLWRFRRRSGEPSPDATPLRLTVTLAVASSTEFVQRHARGTPFLNSSVGVEAHGRTPESEVRWIGSS